MGKAIRAAWRVEAGMRGTIAKLPRQDSRRYEAIRRGKEIACEVDPGPRKIAPLLPPVQRFLWHFAGKDVLLGAGARKAM